MRRFRFRLQAVLEYRETLERLREQDFLNAQGHLQTIEQRIAALKTDYRDTLSARPGCRPGEHFDAPGIQDRERYLAAALENILRMERSAEAARVVAEEMRSALVKARQAREAVSRLREQDLEAYTIETLKREQEELDEMATIRHVAALHRAQGAATASHSNQKEAT